MHGPAEVALKPPGTPFLMYHEILEPGRSPARPGAGYARYVIGRETFGEQLVRIAAAGLRGIAVGEALAGGGAGRIVLTFDDGCESDLVVAAPLLAASGFGATFYVTSGDVGSAGFLSAWQVRELADLGFEVGSHSATHAFLSRLEPGPLRTELLASKDRLEQITGRPVHHLSCPGGRWSRRVAETARLVGYASVADSRPVANRPGADTFRLGRFPVTDTVTMEEFARILAGAGSGARRAKALLLGAARGVFGDRLYDTARRLVLERRRG